jgi:hypothetical protein
MALYSLPKPKIVKQPPVGDGDIVAPVCWAAALSSWLAAARGADWSIGNLVQRFSAFCNGGVSLDLSHLDDVADALFVSMNHEELDNADLTFDYLYDKIVAPNGVRGSYLYIVLLGKNPAHAVVGYGVRNEGDAEFLGIMDPFKGVLAAPVLSDFRRRAASFWVGWAQY